MNTNRPATVNDIDKLFELRFEAMFAQVIERMKEVFVTKEDLRRELAEQSSRITSSLEGTISEAADEILNAVHDRFDIVEDHLDRIDDRLDRHLAV